MGLLDKPMVDSASVQLLTLNIKITRSYKNWDSLKTSYLLELDNYSNKL
jgi:hypothetical protein